MPSTRFALVIDRSQRSVLLLTLRWLPLMGTAPIPTGGKPVILLLDL